MSRKQISLLVFLGVYSAMSWAQDAPLGFFESSLEAQEAAEQVFLSTPAPDKAREWLARLTEEPHVAGTPQEKVVADYVRERLEEFGLATEVVAYNVYLNHPVAVSAKLTQPEEIELQLKEDYMPVDKDSSGRGMFPAFHGYSASGSASGQVVYVNYGTPEDYKKLDKEGIDVADRIVLARYGQVFRGLKVYEAQQRGAAGVLIYSDPADDGYMKGDVYPDGPMRPPSAIQRGSVQFLSRQPGDPSTPGYPSRDDARRLSRAEMTGVPKIPSLPIGYGEAEKILRRLGGPRVPDEWQGGLPFAYHFGPGGAAIEMSVEMKDGLLPIYNVFGRIPGSENPEQLVILGNHRDAWNHGAVDPNSGTTAWLEAARALGAAVRSGWQPRRTILFASWDAEEYGLLGSVEWGEDRAEELMAKTVAYINIDGAVTGKDLKLSGTPSLRDVAIQASLAVTDPSRGGSVGADWKKRSIEEWAKSGPIELNRPDDDFPLHLNALGSGSDYTVFLDHLGIASLDFSFSGPYGVYHSVYDDFRWMDKFGDPGFVYHVAAARLLGLFAMRLASPEVAPLRFGSYAEALSLHLDDLDRQAIRKRRKTMVPDQTEEVAVNGNLDGVRQALEEFAKAGAALDSVFDGVVARQDLAAATRLSKNLLQIEHGFLSEDGLPNRPWFRNLVWAPGLTTGYAPWPFPEIAEAIEDGNQELFDHGKRRVIERLTETSQLMRAAASDYVSD